MKAVQAASIPNVGVRLVSFAVHWIRAEIHEFVLRNWRLVSVATTKAQRKLFFNLRKAKKHLGWLSKAETEAVAARSRRHPARGHRDGAAAERPRRLVRPRSRGRRGLRARPTYLPSPNSDPAHSVERDDEGANAHERLDGGAWPSSTSAAATILARRWLAESKATLHELAAEYGVSAERIRQIEANAIGEAQEADRGGLTASIPALVQRKRAHRGDAPFVVSTAANRQLQRQRDERELHAAVLLTAGVRVVGRDRAGLAACRP